MTITFRFQHRLRKKNGFDYALTQIRFTAGYNAENQHESVSFSHGILAKTSKLKVIAAILPGPWKPVLAAKQLATIHHLTQGRIAINVVSRWFRGEFDAIGEAWPEHDQRYARSEEFIRALKGVWTQDNYSFDGKYYQFKDYTLSPKPVQKPHIEIFQGGSSRAARDMAARVSDWYFTNGNTPEELKKQIDDIRAESPTEWPSGQNWGSMLSSLPEIQRKKRKRFCKEIIDKANIQAVHAFGDATREAGAATLEGEGNWAKSTFEDLVQYNDGFKTNLIGTPRQIAERIVELKTVGVDLILSGFLHFMEEVEYFGAKVLPLVRAVGSSAAMRCRLPNLLSSVSSRHELKNNNHR